VGQRRVLESVHSPHLRACLDIGHARIYSKVPLETWIETFSPFLVYTHLHNTNGIMDVHLRFDDGLIDMPTLLGQLRALPHPPLFCLELPDIAAIQASLKYLQLDRNC
jgi:sugar phosphate isomerase/epimerase